MPDDLDAAALMAALDATERAGVPMHLVERLRDLVDFHARFAPDRFESHASGVRVTFARRAGDSPGYPLFPSDLMALLGPLVAGYFMPPTGPGATDGGVCPPVSSSDAPLRIDPGASVMAEAPGPGG